MPLPALSRGDRRAATQAFPSCPAARHPLDWAAHKETARPSTNLARRRLLQAALAAPATVALPAFAQAGFPPGVVNLVTAQDPAPVGDVFSIFLLSLLAFAMGLQNAAVASTTGLAVRTTHLTGPATDLGIEAKHMLRLRDRLYKMLGDATGKTMETIHRDFDRNKWLFAEEAVEYGCADKVLDRAPELAPRRARDIDEDNGSDK